MAESSPTKGYRTAITILAPLDFVYKFFRDHQSRLLALRVVEEVPGAVLTWHGSDEGGRGRVLFTALPGNRGTMIQVQADVGRSQISRVERSLRQLRALLEGGEVPTIEGQPRGGPDNEETLNPLLH